MKKAWYKVKAMKLTDTRHNNPLIIEFDFFGDPNSDEGYALAMEIAKNKLHTTESVVMYFEEM